MWSESHERCITDRTIGVIQRKSIVRFKMLIAEQLRDDYNCESGDENAAIDDGGDAIEAKVDEDEEEPLLNYESVESFILNVKGSLKFLAFTV